MFFREHRRVIWLRGICERINSPEDGNNMFLKNIGIYLQVQNIIDVFMVVRTSYLTELDYTVCEMAGHLVGQVLTARVDHLEIHAGLRLARVAERRRVCGQGATSLAVADVHHRLGGVAHETRCNQTHHHVTTATGTLETRKCVLPHQ
jgi:hypothetical protein